MGRGVVVKKNKLLEQLRELGARMPTVAVGFIGEKGAATHKDDHGREATVAEIATWNHFGTSTIPARPALTIALERHGPELRKLQERIARGIIEGKLGVNQGLGLLGEAAVGFVKQTISEGVPPPNAKSTLEKLGHSTAGDYLPSGKKPLIATSQMIGSASFEIRDNDGH
jgi:hypothetical protein